ncbi:hypothetical protein BDA96_02G338100 [Sorghum bicolor]|uniref:Uncharacterized protein n=2 Tax=Sorghum bicolor TaxID=4558 RepID=A0A921RS24_SORBI|nr:hypothetical protein BDA96_02G338100 [Sorghum bicolor]OQU90030.1 hypothetical protein SORBI_3002G322101 [Sorghum bicolor]
MSTLGYVLVHIQGIAVEYIPFQGVCSSCPRSLVIAGATFSVTFKKENGRELCVWLTNSLHKISKLYNPRCTYLHQSFSMSLVVIDLRGRSTVVVLDIWSMCPYHS